MNIIVRKYAEDDVLEMAKIWNEIVEEGIAFPQENILSYEEAREFFNAQSYCGVAVNSDNDAI